MLAFEQGNTARKRLLIIIVAANITALFGFKYLDLFANLAASLSGFVYEPLLIAIPLGISFYTFQEITLAVDAYRGVPKVSLAKYVLFIVFFPHLIAGPLVHHREMVPQFSRFRVTQRDLAVGLALFTIGLTKKLCIADPLGVVVKIVFDAPADHPPGMLAAWTGTLAYTFQIYFDFSGYSDMALGLGRLFGIRLPVNFFSPYKARDISDFWGRWHMTLSRFLREYVYIPLGGNRKGPSRRHVNLMVVMLVGGLWHGDNWTFLLWGGLHGVFLVTHHLWHEKSGIVLGYRSAQLLTFLCVVVAWVPFRAADIPATVAVWKGMIGLNGVGGISSVEALASQFDQVLASGAITATPDLLLVATLVSVCVLYLWCILTPNAIELLQLRHPWPGRVEHSQARSGRFFAAPTLAWGWVFGMMFGLSLLLSRQFPQEFLYWKF